MIRANLVALLLFSFSLPALACMTGALNLASESATSLLSIRRFKTPQAPGYSALPSASHHAWGGSDATKWTQEAVFANAVSQALNEGWTQTEAALIQDVLVAVPVKMQNGTVPVAGNYGNWPYGDGQTNAHVTFGDWPMPAAADKAPPLVVTLTLFKSGARTLRFRFHNPTSAVELKTEHGSYVIPDGHRVWPLPPDVNFGDLFTNRVAFVRAQGSSSWFPLDFRNVVLDNEALLDQISPAQRRLAEGSLLDPKRVKASPLIAFDVVEPLGFAHDLNGQRFSPVVGIHNSFITRAGTGLATAVGNGTTVVLPSPKMSPPGPAPFKMAYICFDPRNEEQEANTGAPSGAGWHEIGDPAETVINSLEDAPVLFGYANGQPAPNTPSDTFAYGLTDVAVVRLLQPGTALVTAAGSQSRRELGQDLRGLSGPAERNYHWFVMNQTQNVCAMEWVHPCVPNSFNSLGLNCPQL